MTIELDWLKHWTRETPARIAIQDGDTGKSYSYAQLLAHSVCLSTRLAREFGIGKGDRVAVLAGNEIEVVVLLFAVQRLGAILLPLNYRLAGAELELVLLDAQAQLLICQAPLAASVEGLAPAALPEQRWAFDGTPDALRPWLAAQSTLPPENLVALPVIPEDPCMILYTSGTTGRMKGVLVTYAMIHWNSLNTAISLSLTSSDCNISFLPFFHTGAWNVLTLPLLHHGARVVFTRKFEAEAVLQLAARERATILFGVPTTMAMLARAAGFDAADLTAMRYAIVGGEPMPLPLIRAWCEKGVPIRQGYGLTEFGPNVFSLGEADALRKIGSIGVPNTYVEARLVADNGTIVAGVGSGELALRGPVCTPGYWRNPRDTQNTIREGWLYTGDIVRRDEDGYYFVVGRKKDMFISGGENVYPLEIEAALRRHPEIEDVCVVGVADPQWGEAGKAFVVLKAGARCDADAVRAHCRLYLARYKVPKSVEFLPDLPKTDSGKVLKRQLSQRTQ